MGIRHAGLDRTVKIRRLPAINDAGSSSWHPRYLDYRAAAAASSWLPIPVHGYVAQEFLIRSVKTRSSVIQRNAGSWSRCIDTDSVSAISKGSPTVNYR